MSIGDLPISDNNSDLNLDNGQDLVLRDNHGTERVRLDADTGILRLRSGAGETAIQLDGATGNLLMGGFGSDGDLLLFPNNAGSHNFSAASIHLNGDSPSIGVGSASLPGTLNVEGDGHRVEVKGITGKLTLSGRIDVRTTDGTLITQINNAGNVIAGGGGKDGLLRLRKGNADTTILLNGANGESQFGGNGEDGRIEVRDRNDVVTIVLNGATGNLGLGAATGGNAGALFIKDSSGNDSAVINGGNANASFGRSGNAGALYVKDASGENSVVINGATGNIGLGHGGNGGALFIKDNSGSDTLVLNGETANIGIGRNGREGNLFVKNDAGQNTIHLSGQTGDILLANADCAEDFNVRSLIGLDPGSVMVIADDERLDICTEPYDKRVAGVVSGAGAYKPGIVLDKRAGADDRLPVALMGKVYCKVDAAYGAIAIGDMLTTSATPGHAMRVGDHSAAFGAVIGKALRPLAKGKGLIPVLVALQ